eukprot:Em0001g3760a
MAPISPESTNELWSHPQCSGTARDVGSLVGTGTHLLCGYMEQLRVCPKVLCNSQEWHPSPLVSLYTPTLWVHGTAQSVPQSALQLTRMAPIFTGQLVHTYPVGTWNSSESAPKCFATHKNGTHLHWYTPTLWVHGTAQSVPQSALQLTRMAPISIGQLVHTYPVGTWNSSESASKCFATHKNGTHLDWYTPTLWVHGTAQSVPQSALQLTRMAPISIGQLVHTYPVGTWNSSESAPKCFATHKNGTHLHWYTPTLWVHGTAQSLSQSALQLTRMAPIFTGQLVHTYPVGTWNSSESAPKCFATHKNGTHLHWYTPTLWVHGIAQSLPQSALQLTRMAPIFTGQLVHTYPVGTWNSSESAPKCFATHKNGTHLHCALDPRVTLGPWLAQVHTYPVVTWNSSESAPKCFATHKNGTHLHCVPNPRVTLGPWLAQVHTYPVGTWNSSESAPKCFATHKNGTHLHWYTPTLWVHGTAQSVPQSALQLTRMAPISIGQLVHTYPVGTWNSSECASKCFATHKNGTHLDCVLDPRVTLGPWLEQVHTYPVGTWNSSESAPKCFATHKNGTHLHWYTPTLWVHGTAQSLSQSALQLTRMAPIFTGQLVHTYPVGTWNSSECASKCFATHKNGTHLDWYTPTLWVHGTAQSLPQSALQLTRMAPISIGQLVHTYPVGTWNSSESAPKCFATHKNGTHLHCVPNPRVTLGPWLAQVHTYPVGTWNSSESAPKCFATHKNGTHLHCVLDPRVTLGPWLAQVHTYPVGTWNSSESASKCFATHKNGTHLDWYTPTLWVHGIAQSLPQSALQLTRMAPISIGQLVHTYPVGTWNSSESAPKCFATHKNGTHLHCVLDPRVTLGPWLAQVHTYPVGTWNSSESASKCFATHKNGTHLDWYTPTLWVHGTAQSLPQSALQLTRMAPIFTGQLVHTYPVGTWNSSESAPKCFATHKNGTHLHCVLDPRVTLGPWLEQVHTYPVGTWNSSECASKCFATHKNGTHLDWSASQSLPQSALQLTRMAPISIGQLVHTYLVGTWNSSESAPKCFATHKNGTHLHWYTPTLWVHGIAQSLPQSALQLTRMAPISIGQLVHTYPVGTWNSSESAPKCFATHKNGTHLHWSACTHLPCGYMEQLRVCLKVLCNSQEWHPSRLVSLYTPTLWVHGTAQSLPQSALQLTRMAPISIGQLVHTYLVGTWNSSESAPKCFATHKNGTHLHWYTPTLWVHGIAQSLPQSALQLTRMAPISIGQLVHTYPVGTWNSSESAPKCFATHKNGTHLHWYTPTLWVHGTAQSVPQSALQLTRMAPISIGQLVHTYPVGTWNSSECASKCFATHKNGTHLDWYTPTLWVHGTAQSLPQSALQLTRMAPISIGQLVHTYPVGTWNSSESVPKCFATHKNGTHLHWYTPTLWVHGIAQSLPQSALQLTRMAPIFTGQLVHTYPVGTWNSSESAPKCFATHKNGTHLHWYTPTLWVHGIAQSLPQSALQLTRMAPISIGQLVHTFPVGTWNSSESAPKCFATHKNGTHLN